MSGPKRVTVAELARRVDLDVDEALIVLWDAGLERYESGRDVLRSRDLRVASRALGIPTSRELTNPEYWRRRLELSQEEFDSLLQALEIRMSANARRLPKGAVAKLKRAALTTLRAAQPLDGGTAPQTETEPVEWRTVGREQEVRLLTRDEVEAIHWELVRDFASDSDPIVPPGVRDEDLLESAIFRQHTSLGIETKYPTVEMAGAALLHSLVHDHPFHNGNKRTALVSMIVLLDENGSMLTATQEELFRFVIRLANHQIVAAGRDQADRETLETAEWIRQHSRNLERGDRPVQWRRLRRILRNFGCQLEAATGTGNRINIVRILEEARRIRRPRKRVLKTQVRYTDDGREATITTIKKIRADLELDEVHGCDSIAFYRQSGPAPGDFIVRYRKTLQRLAKL